MVTTWHRAVFAVSAPHSVPYIASEGIRLVPCRACIESAALAPLPWWPICRLVGSMLGPVGQGRKRIRGKSGLIVV